MKKILFFFFFLFLFSFLSSYNGDSGVLVTKGVNEMNLNLTRAVYVKDIVRLNPDIEYVSYLNGYNENVYINVFGGVGENFVVYSQDIKIVSGKNITLVLPL